MSQFKKINTLILGGPNKYYSFSEKQMTETFAKIKNLFVYSKYKLIVIPSYRTPENIVKLAFNYFNDNHLVIKERDKKDSERKIAPLKKAQDAIELVTDGMNIEDVLKEITYIFRSKIPEEVWPTPSQESP